ncbi:PIR protein CIR protein [Plasmodium vinckei brucechwatti]|uniref:PIR protein CIR protein n=1 Tax=Plasmodium vinckei brucechwatti TaxID=119398 RepID=A0A6V7RTW6_PLAVN|nr:PIR protein CIR protein [Plasmodium vinckei brucechwatti]
MNDEMCQIFQGLWADFPDTLHNGNYQFKNEINDTYCKDNIDNCATDLDKINVACFVLFETFFKDSNFLMKNAKNNINIAGYILAWLSYILSLKENEEINNLNDFYKKYIKDKNMYNNHITGVNGYTSYQNLIDKYKELMTIDIKNIPNFYAPLKSLCNMYTMLYTNDNNCTKYLGYAIEFAQKYNELNKDPKNNENNSYKNVLYSLSTDYNNLKKYLSGKCSNSSDISSFPEVEAPHGPFEIFEATPSSSSIASILIPVLSIFVAIPIFLRIAYKYSLFGFDKRLHRQYLREKIKKIKKKMNNYI